MANKSIISIVIIASLILVGVWWFFGQNKKISVPPFVSSAEGIHFIGENVHIIEGFITLPNPCNELSVFTDVRESFPEQVVVRFETRKTADVCVQAEHDAEFRVTFTASSDAQIEATLNGESILLTLENRSFVVAPVMEEFTLAFDEEKRVDTVPIRFIGIEEESRCPQGAQCIQAGRAVINLVVADEHIVLALPGDAEIPNAAVVGSYLVTVTAVNPIPVLEEKFSEEQYIITLRFEIIDTKA
jgi:hypothetical protein